MMKRLRNLNLCVLVICVLSGMVYGDAVPSTHPGVVGAIPYAGGTTFRVWAPNATYVNVMGDFNGWSGTSKPLGSEADGWWSRDVTGALVGHEYRFKINGTLSKIDPRAQDVTNSTGNGIIVDNSYSWTPFTPPAWNEMVIYEMHIGTYNDTAGGNPGTWALATSKLDHLQDLGVNVVEVMPVSEFAGDFSLGYNPANLFAPESAYGDPSQMRDFVEQCHQRGIAVLIDVVYNHLGGGDLDHSVWQFDGFSTYPDTGGIYFFEDENSSTPWGDRPNYTTEQVRSYIRDNAKYWLNDFNCDGLRIDGTAYVRERDDGGSVPWGWGLLQLINDDIDAAYAEKISIAEDMRGYDRITKPTSVDDGAGFDSQWDAWFHHSLVYALETSDDNNRNMYEMANIINHKYNGVDTQRVIYTESHDEVGASSGKSRVPSRIWWDNPTSYYSKKRSTLGAGIVFTSPGIPMIFMGQEFLEIGSWHDDDPLDWTNDTTYAGIKLMYQHMISLRRNLSNNTLGLMAGNVNTYHINDTAKVIAYHRWWNGGPGDDVIVVANFSYQGITNYNIGMPRGGRWRVRLNSDWIGYDSEFLNWDSLDTNAVLGTKDGLGYNANVSVAPYSFIILSQGTGPNLDGIGKVDMKDFALFAAQWQNPCNDWDSCQGADFNMSGLVDMTDLYTFVSRWLDDTP